MLKKIYIFVPIFALVLFTAYYVYDNQAYEAKEAAQAKTAEQARVAKLRKQAEDQALAIKEANQAIEERKKETDAKNAKLAAEKQAIQDAFSAEDTAKLDVRKFTDRVKDLNDQIKTEQDAITKIEVTRKNELEQQAFLRKYIAGAQENVTQLQNTLQKVVDADAARAAAAALAAAKNKS